MTEAEFSLLKTKVLSDLEEKLDPRLTYHSRRHTEDVLFQTERIAVEEKIDAPRLLMLMKVAALFHDTGFIDTYRDHEKRSCEIMAETLKDYEFDCSEIDLMRNMILATKVPQSPATLQDMIICDADLDYLGRNDFPEISNRLKDELLAFGFIKNENEWDDLQLKFLSNHRYFTHSSVTSREAGKRSHFSALTKNLETDKP